MGAHERERLILRPGATVARRDEFTLQIGIDSPLVALVPNTAPVRALLDALVSGRQPRSFSAEAQRALIKMREARLIVPEAKIDARPVEFVESDGPVRRELIDELMRADRVHLTLASGPEGWTLGPFTVPGRSACLRCVDAARSERDPKRSLIVQQGRSIDPIAPHAKAIAMALAERDLAAWAAGARPLTFNATVTVPLGPEGASEAATLPFEERWRPHAHCGCTWDRLQR